jgi:hypothetical protein
MSATPVTAASMDIECAAAPAAAEAAPQKSAGRRWGLAAAVLATAALSVGAIAALTTQQSQQAAQLAVDRSLLNIAPGSLASGRSNRLKIGISTEVSIPDKSEQMNGAKVDMALMYQPIKAVNSDYFQYLVDVSTQRYNTHTACCVAHTHLAPLHSNLSLILAGIVH